MNAFQQFLKDKPFGFITEKDLPELIRMHRLCQCLVRCGGGRFVCAAQDVSHFLKCVAAGGDYVRDVSVTSQEIQAADAWRDEPVYCMASAPIGAERFNQVAYTAAVDGDYGGAFDGSRVTSDADPGL